MERVIEPACDQHKRIIAKRRNDIMDRLAESRFRLDISRGQMKKIGFRYDHELDGYIYRFPVYKYRNVPLLFCWLGIDEDTRTVWHDIYDSNGTLYPPYYDRGYGQNEIIPQIEDMVLAELDRLGAVKVG